MVRLRTFVLLISVIVIHTNEADSQTASPTPPAHMLVFEAQPGPDIPTLQVIAGEGYTVGVFTDADVMSAVVAYYHANAERLAILWREDHPVRLAGIFAMYLSHISQVYGATPFPTSVMEFMSQRRAHCGTYFLPQHHVADALGLTYRVVEFVDEHAFMEIYVDGHWELFDATTNVWISRPAVELQQGVVREYRMFYTPMLDIDRPDARLHLAEGSDMPRLRRRMPLMGIEYFPPGERKIGGALGPLAEEIEPQGTDG